MPPPRPQRPFLFIEATAGGHLLTLFVTEVDLWVWCGDICSIEYPGGHQIDDSTA